MMNSLKRAYQFFKTYYFQDFLAEICICSFVCTFLLGAFATIFVRETEPYAPNIFIACIIIAILLAVTFLYSYIKKKRTMTLVFIVLFLWYSVHFAGLFMFGYFYAILFSACERTSSYFHLAFVVPLIFPLCSNVFVWHFRNKYDGRSAISFRIFILLVTNLLVSLILAGALTPLTEYAIVILPLFFGAITIVYITYRILREKNEEIPRMFKGDSTRTSPYYDTLVKVHYAAYVFFLITILIAVFFGDLLSNIHPPSGNCMHILTPAFFKTHAVVPLILLVFCLLWGLSILANPKSLAAKICTIFSVTSIVPICLNIIFIDLLAFDGISFHFINIIYSFKKAILYMTNGTNPDIGFISTICWILFAIGCFMTVGSHLYRKWTKEEEKEKEK